MEADDISRAIKNRRASIARLQAEIETLEQARGLLAGEAAAAALPQETASRLRPVKNSRRGGRRRKGVISAESAPGHAAAVLKENGSELHVTEIHKRMNERGKAIAKSSVWSTLAKMAKRGKLFYKGARPGFFGLLEWKAARMAAQEGTAAMH